MRYTYHKSQGIVFLDSVTVCGFGGIDLARLQAKASEYYSGQTSPMYAFASTGAVSDELHGYALESADYAKEQGNIEDGLILLCLARVAEAVTDDGRFAEPDSK